MNNLSIGRQDVARPLSLPVRGAPAPVVTLPSAGLPEGCRTRIVQFLVQNGVSTVFGLPGGPLFPIYDALLDCPSIRVINCKHETMAVFAAAAYARATESVGVVLVTSGPGITNSLTGLASAFCDSLPVLMLAGEVPRRQFARRALQEGSPYSLDVRAMVHSITKATFELTNSRSTGAVMGKALATALLRPQKGPIFVSLPLDVTPGAALTPARDRSAGLASSGHRRSRASRRRGRSARLSPSTRSSWLDQACAGAGVPEQLLRLAERGGSIPARHRPPSASRGVSGEPPARPWAFTDTEAIRAPRKYRRERRSTFSSRPAPVSAGGKATNT